ncbi:hypothetical protein EJB05_01168 [Eragrostis curvula]|uniref:Uncharacterized protein n=1 Tax=Eragrostis curvula TaxID=38414 RepID=A0A5J9WR83_9POAL|nr:hypothetical protein EJB05_01168 [Eragrostis curvula]
MTYDQHDYEMDNGKPRPINQDMLHGLSIVEHECPDPMQGHSAEANGNVCLPDNQLVTSDSRSKQHDSMRLESVGVAQNEQQQHQDVMVQEEAPLPQLDEQEQEAAQLEEQQQQYLDELEEEEEEEEEEAAAALQEQQDQDNLEQAVAWLRSENECVAACAMDIVAQYVSVNGENSVLRACAVELDDRLRSVNEVLHVIEEFSGVAMDIQEEPQEEDNQPLEPWHLLCLAASV